MFFSSPTQDAQTSLDDFKELMQSTSGSSTENRTADCIEPLRGLAADLPSIIEQLCEEIFAASDDPARLPPNSNYFNLCEAGGARLRLSLWRPNNFLSTFETLNGKPYSYDLAHDHDFDLLSVAAFGPGYLTTVYRNDAGDQPLEIGAAPRARRLGDFKMSPGSVIYYEQNYDIHAQHPPESLSMTINMIWMDRKKPKRGQYYYDQDCQTVVELADNRSTRLLSVVRLLVAYGARDRYDLVREFIRLSDDPCFGDRCVAEFVLGGDHEALVRQQLACHAKAA
jgi:hypothetical protein